MITPAQVKKRFVAIGGYVTEGRHRLRYYVGPRDLCQLYRINPEEAVLIDARAPVPIAIETHNLIELRPQWSGDYRLPKEAQA